MPLTQQTSYHDTHHYQQQPQQEQPSHEPSSLISIYQNNDDQHPHSFTTVINQVIYDYLMVSFPEELYQKILTQSQNSRLILLLPPQSKSSLSYPTHNNNSNNNNNTTSHSTPHNKHSSSNQPSLKSSQHTQRQSPHHSSSNGTQINDNNEGNEEAILVPSLLPLSVQSVLPTHNTTLILPLFIFTSIAISVNLLTDNLSYYISDQRASGSLLPWLEEEMILLDVIRQTTIDGLSDMLKQIDILLDNSTTSPITPLHPRATIFRDLDGFDLDGGEEERGVDMRTCYYEDFHQILSTALKKSSFILRSLSLPSLALFIYLHNDSSFKHFYPTDEDDQEGILTSDQITEVLHLSDYGWVFDHLSSLKDDLPTMEQLQMLITPGNSSLVPSTPNQPSLHYTTSRPLPKQTHLSLYTTSPFGCDQQHSWNYDHVGIVDDDTTNISILWSLLHHVISRWYLPLFQIPTTSVNWHTSSHLPLPLIVPIPTQQQHQQHLIIPPQFSRIITSNQHILLFVQYIVYTMYNRYPTQLHLLIAPSSYYDQSNNTLSSNLHSITHESSSPSTTATMMRMKAITSQSNRFNTLAFEDGVLFCLIISFYRPDLIPPHSIALSPHGYYTTQHETSHHNELNLDVVQNFSLLNQALQALNIFPYFYPNFDETTLVSPLLPNNMTLQPLNNYLVTNFRFERDGLLVLDPLIIILLLTFIIERCTSLPPDSQSPSNHDTTEVSDVPLNTYGISHSIYHSPNKLSPPQQQHQKTQSPTPPQQQQPTSSYPQPYTPRGKDNLNRHNEVSLSNASSGPGLTPLPLPTVPSVQPSTQHTSSYYSPTPHISTPNHRSPSSSSSQRPPVSSSLNSQRESLLYQYRSPLLPINQQQQQRQTQQQQPLNQQPLEESFKFPESRRPTPPPPSRPTPPLPHEQFSSLSNSPFSSNSPIPPTPAPQQQQQRDCMTEQGNNSPMLSTMATSTKPATFNTTTSIFSPSMRRSSQFPTSTTSTSTITTPSHHTTNQPRQRNYSTRNSTQFHGANRASVSSTQQQHNYPHNTIQNQSQLGLYTPTKSPRRHIPYQPHSMIRRSQVKSGLYPRPPAPGFFAFSSTHHNHRHYHNRSHVLGRSCGNPTRMSLNSTTNLQNPLRFSLGPSTTTTTTPSTPSSSSHPQDMGHWDSPSHPFPPSSPQPTPPSSSSSPPRKRDIIREHDNQNPDHIRAPRDLSPRRFRNQVPSYPSQPHHQTIQVTRVRRNDQHQYQYQYSHDEPHMAYNDHNLDGFNDNYMEKNPDNNYYSYSPLPTSISQPPNHPHPTPSSQARSRPIYSRIDEIDTNEDMTGNNYHHTNLTSNNTTSSTTNPPFFTQPKNPEFKNWASLLDTLEAQSGHHQPRYQSPTRGDHYHHHHHQNHGAIANDSKTPSSYQNIIHPSQSPLKSRSIFNFSTFDEFLNHTKLTSPHQYEVFMHFRHHNRALWDDLVNLVIERWREHYHRGTWPEEYIPLPDEEFARALRDHENAFNLRHADYHRMKCERLLAEQQEVHHNNTTTSLTHNSHHSPPTSTSPRLNNNNNNHNLCSFASIEKLPPSERFYYITRYFTQSERRSNALILLQRKIKARLQAKIIHIHVPGSLIIFDSFKRHREEQRQIEQHGELVGITALIHKQQRHFVDSLCDGIEIVSTLLQHYAAIVHTIFPTIHLLQRRLEPKGHSSNESIYNQRGENVNVNHAQLQASPHHNVIEILDHDVVSIPLTETEQIEFDETYPPILPPKSHYQVHLDNSVQSNQNNNINNNNKNVTMNNTTLNLMTINSNPNFVNYVHAGIWYKFYIVLNRLTIVSSDMDFFLAVHPLLSTQELTGIIPIPLNVQNLSIQSSTSSSSITTKPHKTLKNKNNNPLNITTIPTNNTLVLYSHRQFHRKALHTTEQMLLQLLGIFVRIFFHKQLHTFSDAIAMVMANNANSNNQNHNNLTINNHTFIGANDSDYNDYDINGIEPSLPHHLFTNSPHSVDIYLHYLGLYDHIFGESVDTFWHQDAFSYISCVVKILHSIYQHRMINHDKYEKILHHRLEIASRRHHYHPQTSTSLPHSRNHPNISRSNNSGDEIDITTAPSLWNINTAPVMNETITKQDIDHLSLWYSTIHLDPKSAPPIIDYLLDNYPTSINTLLPTLASQKHAKDLDKSHNFSYTNRPIPLTPTANPSTSRLQFQRGIKSPEQRAREELESRLALQRQENEQLQDKRLFTAMEFVSLLYNSGIPHFIPIVKNVSRQHFSDHCQKLNDLIEFYGFVTSGVNGD